MIFKNDFIPGIIIVTILGLIITGALILLFNIVDANYYYY